MRVIVCRLCPNGSPRKQSRGNAARLASPNVLCRTRVTTRACAMHGTQSFLYIHDLFRSTFLSPTVPLHLCTGFEPHWVASAAPIVTLASTVSRPSRVAAHDYDLQQRSDDSVDLAWVRTLATVSISIKGWRCLAVRRCLPSTFSLFPDDAT
jgi:hypothetical protein